MRRIEIIKRCQACDVDYIFYVDIDGYNEWKKGNGFIQDLLPDNTSSERELLISGACGECFDKMFWYKEDENERTKS